MGARLLWLASLARRRDQQVIKEDRRGLPKRERAKGDLAGRQCIVLERDHLLTVAVDDDFVDDFDDLEVLSADEQSGDDGFLTDEEYDILDASDHETVASK